MLSADLGRRLGVFGFFNFCRFDANDYRFPLIIGLVSNDDSMIGVGRSLLFVDLPHFLCR